MFLFYSLLIISQIITVYSDLVEEKQYINDLKEDAKKEFIDRVVKRLAQEVDLKDVPTEETRKMSDDQLDKHSDFVKKIINEEKANFEKEVHDGVRNKEVSSGTRINSTQSLDYTLKEQTRKKRDENSDSNDKKETTKSTNEVTIPVQVVYDEDLSKSTESPVSETPSVGKDDIQVKSKRIQSRKSAQIEDKDLSIKSETENTSNNSKKFNFSNTDTEKILPSDKSRESNEIKSVTGISEERKPTAASLEKNTENVESATKEAAVKEEEEKAETETTTIDNGELLDQNKVRRDSKRDSKNEDYLKNSESSTATPKVKVSEVTLNQNVDTTLPTNVVNKENLPNITQKPVIRVGSLVQSTVPPETKQKEVELNNHLTTISLLQLSETTTSRVPKTVELNKTVDNVKRNKINDLTLTYNPYKAERVMKNNTSKLRNKKVKIVKVGPSRETILRSKFSTVKLENILDPKKPMEVNDELKTLQIAKDIVKALRKGIERDTKNKKLALRKIPNLKQKQVNIYGLRSFVEEKSLEKKVKNREEPYYAPIHNFNPNNAYYNAYNKFGPNYEDSKNNRANEQETDEVIDLPNVPLEKKYLKSFFKKPLTLSKEKKVLSRKPNLKNAFIDKVLYSFIVKQPYNLQQKDYKEFVDDDYYKEKNAFRSGSVIKEIDESLKNHLRHLRNNIYAREQGKNSKEHVKDEEENKGTGWLDDGVKYYSSNLKNLGKTDKPHKDQSISYDYIGEVRFNESKKLRYNQKFRYDDYLPTTKPNPIKTNKEVITRIKKFKDRSDSKEIVETFQKVFPLLKNLVQIVDDDVDEEVVACVKVMGDMINRNDEGLEQYDWLESTVNIQSAIRKLLDLSRAATEGLRMHPADVELLKFITYLFSVATEDQQNGAKSFQSTRAKMPKGKTAKGQFVNHKKLLDESNTWLVRVPAPSKKYTFEYEELIRFLNDLSESLFDLHDALKHISSVTNFKSQHWYEHLKDLYLHDPDRRKLLKVILHLGTTRLFNLIEDNSKNGADDDFRRYILENQTMVSGVKDAFVFVLKVLQAAVYSR